MMCGIAGFLSFKQPLSRKRQWLQGMGEATVGRGRDAWGLMTWSPVGGWAWFKEPRPFTDRTQLTLQEGVVFACLHCRHATHGDPRDNNNNHPVVVNDILVVHNGVVSKLNHYDWRRWRRSYDKVDTFLIAEIFATHSPKTAGEWVKAMDEVNTNLEGSWAVVVANTATDQVLFWGEPLYLAVVPELKAVFWGSTQDIATAPITVVKAGKLFNIHYEIPQTQYEYAKLRTSYHEALLLTLSPKRDGVRFVTVRPTKGRIVTTGKWGGWGGGII